MQGSFLKRPFHSQERITSPGNTGNIFANGQEVHLPVIKQLARSEDRDYHVIGPLHLRRKILEEQNLRSDIPRVESLEKFEQRQSLPQLGKTGETSLLRASGMSKLTKQESKALTRDKRYLEFHKEYQKIWQRSSRKFRQQTGGTHPTLLQGSVQRLQVMPNPQKDELLKNFVNSYWEMSLRNNNSILKRLIKGETRYGQIQMEGMLQSEEGTKIIEKSIPKLPVEKLREAEQRQFVLRGRNKLASESLSCDPSIASQYTSRLSKAMTDGAVLDRNKQIWKMDYDSSHSFLKEETAH